LVRELTDEDNVKKLTSVEQNMKRVLTFLLGFFVTQSIRRWWNQTSKIPHLTDLAVVCNAIFQPGDQGEESMKESMRELLRLSGLSYSIVLLSLSSCQEGAKTDREKIKILLDTKLASKDELKILGFLLDNLEDEDNLADDFFTLTGASMQKWYLPMMWASGMVQEEMGKGKSGHLEKEAKEIAKNILHFKRDLEVVAEYSQRPLPLIAEHALSLLFWTTMIFGTLDNTHKFLDMTQNHYSLVFGILLDFFIHIDELIVFILLYAWLKMAIIAKNPFNNDKHYDIDVIREINKEIFEATVAININRKK